jgi:hypothetical protein
MHLISFKNIKDKVSVYLNSENNKRLYKLNGKFYKTTRNHNLKLTLLNAKDVKNKGYKFNDYIYL